jgi:hypothetical protein
MAMAVHHGLPGSLSDITADIVTGRPEIFLNNPPAFIDEFRHGLLFLTRKGKVVRGMPEWHDQEVSF